MEDQDALTKLWSRGKFDSEFAQCFTEATNSGRPLSLVMADIDHFKAVNDTYGHQVRDTVLARVAECIATIAEGKGRVYRYGGEEIALVLNNHDVREATAVAERARRKLESIQIKNISVTASFGVGTFPDHGHTGAEIIKAADTALYDAKNRGRNLVRVFKEPPPTDKAREPERKLPKPGAFTEEQKAQLRQQHFQGYHIRCQRDGAILSVKEITEIGSATARLIVSCKMCGLIEEF
jgi:diguanylate cyclase (GGDEF)-like protein